LPLPLQLSQRKRPQQPLRLPQPLLLKRLPLQLQPRLSLRHRLLKQLKPLPKSPL
jgi:hypothetical protein